jgi:hypothetical protein
MTTHTDLTLTPAEGTPAALRAQLRDKIRQLPAHVDANGNPATPQAIETFDPPRRGVTEGPTVTSADVLASLPGWGGWADRS